MIFMSVTKPHDLTLFPPKDTQKVKFHLYNNSLVGDYSSVYLELLNHPASPYNQPDFV